MAVLPTISQITLFFQHLPTGEGWRETYTNTMSYPPSSQAVGALTTSRITFLADDCQVYAYRIAQIQPSRIAQAIHYFNPQGGQILIPCEEPGNCFVYHVFDNLGHRRQMALRGIPNTWIQSSSLTSAGRTGAKLSDAFAAFLVANGYSFYIPYSASTPIPVGGILSPGAGLNANVTTYSPHGLNFGQYVKFTKIKGWPTLKGLWAVQPTMTNTIFVLVGSGRYSFQIVTAVGQCQLVQPITKPYARYNYSEVSWRRTGKVSFLPRGKGSAVLLHR